MDYKVTVVVPTFNVENFIHKTIDSLKNQTLGFENIEIIIVDDCSTDSTINILKEYEENYPNIHCFYQEKNTGSPSSGRNMGINNASSKYLMFLDADDEYENTMCEVLYNAIEEYSADIVNCRLYLSKNGENIKEKCILDKKDDIMILNSIDEYPPLLVLGSACNKIYRRSFLLENEIHFAVNELYEDAFFCLHSFTKASKIVSLNNYFGIYYNIRDSGEDNSVTKTFNRRNLIKLHKGFKRILNYLDESNKSYPEFEFQTLMGFTKWILLSDCEKEKKLQLYREYKAYYKKFSIFLRLENVPLIKNILMNIFMKLISFNEFSFKIFIDLFDSNWFRQKLQSFHYLN